MHVGLWKSLQDHQLGMACELANQPETLLLFGILEFWKYVQLYRKFALMKVDFSIC